MSAPYPPRQSPYPAATSTFSETAPQSRSCAAPSGRCLQSPARTPASAPRCARGRSFRGWFNARWPRRGAYPHRSDRNTHWQRPLACVRLLQARRIYAPKAYNWIMLTIVETTLFQRQWPMYWTEDERGQHDPIVRLRRIDAARLKKPNAR